jgi:hypothetical protein
VLAGLRYLLQALDEADIWAPGNTRGVRRDRACLPELMATLRSLPAVTCVLKQSKLITIEFCDYGETHRDPLHKSAQICPGAILPAGRKTPHCIVLHKIDESDVSQILALFCLHTYPAVGVVWVPAIWQVGGRRVVRTDKAKRTVVPNGEWPV